MINVRTYIVEDCKFAPQQFEYESDDVDLSVVLLQLCKMSTAHESRAIKAIVYTLPELISVQNKKISEAHLSTSFVHPIIRSTFGSRNDVSHCSNLRQNDRNRPDYKVERFKAQLRKKLLEQLLVITLTSPVSLWVLWIGMSRLRLLSYHG
ncbi:hypothetical protein MFLAVUS_002002 [Mucor flavus]|uniref:Uncharacterized protein n=1 Tax=Mucor flavus TaxID=439312 RepID=A0ABP9YP29_9FUNG